MVNYFITYLSQVKIHLEKMTEGDGTQKAWLRWQENKAG